MLKRFSNITILVICGLLIVGIIISRRVDTAIEMNVERQNKERKIKSSFDVACDGPPQKLITADTAQWVRIQYTLPSFSSYNLDKKNGAWYMDTLQTNALATNIYLGKIANATAACTVTHAQPETLKLPDYILEVITASGETLSLKTYVIDTTYLVQDGNGQLYHGNSDSLFWQLYFGKHRFIPSLSQQ